eukprot:2651539-Prymnesium_polylepis.1
MCVNVDCDEMSLEYPSSPGSSVSSKRERSPSPPPCGAGSSAGHTPPSPGSCASLEPEPEDCTDVGSAGALCEREGRREHQRLRREALAMLLAPSQHVPVPGVGGPHLHRGAGSLRVAPSCWDEH